jgi:hypothetical protein
VLDAADADSGVAAITVKLDGTVVADVAYTCAFDNWSACWRDRAGQVVDVDTTKVSDGQRTLTVAVEDAAGNETRRVLGAVMVANSSIGGTAPVTREQAQIRGRSRRLSRSWRGPAARRERCDERRRYTPRPAIHGAPAYAM